MGSNPCKRCAFFVLICCETCIVCLKGPKINRKGPILLNIFECCHVLVKGIAVPRLDWRTAERITVTSKLTMSKQNIWCWSSLFLFYLVFANDVIVNHMERFSSWRWRLYRPKQKAAVFMLNLKDYATHAWHNSIVFWLLGRCICSSPSTSSTTRQRN